MQSSFPALSFPTVPDSVTWGPCTAPPACTTFIELLAQALGTLLPVLEAGGGMAAAPEGLLGRHSACACVPPPVTISITTHCENNVNTTRGPNWPPVTLQSEHGGLGVPGDPIPGTKANSFQVEREAWGDRTETLQLMSGSEGDTQE